MASSKKPMPKPAKTSVLPAGSLSEISIEGFKSIRAERKLALSALNIVAGANSSGKSSFMQPLLLLKQTLEAAYDPGPLLLDGPNVKFTELSQLFAKSSSKKLLVIGLSLVGGTKLQLSFDLDSKRQLRVKEATLTDPKGVVQQFTASTTQEELLAYLQASREGLAWSRVFKKEKLEVIRQRVFLRIAVILKEGEQSIPLPGPWDEFTESIGRNIIHVPGLRGNPLRSYPKTAVGNNYPGTLDAYVASIIADWQDKGDERLSQLGSQLQQLGLTWKVVAKKLDDTRVELQVGRLPAATQGGAQDLVSIADVGFGVSQVLPVLVALLVARQGQIVYIEQPETHLHPKAQRALAQIFANAASKFATVVVETHSLLFVRAIQTLVAKKSLDKALVKLHWVTRDGKGDTSVATSDLDEAGAYGAWPQDFEATEMDAEQDYLSAAEAVLLAP
jgi:predicted ATPase